jgi:hypothetical protein
MFSILTSALFILTIFKSVHGNPCLAFDINFNLLVFGLAGNDYNAGTQDTWDTSRFWGQLASFLRGLACVQVNPPP